MHFAGVRYPSMIQDDSATEFMVLYSDIYRCLHASWDKHEYYPSSEALAVMNHLLLSGPLTITEAAQHFDRAQSAMSELIDRLQANDYVARIKDSRDRRRTLIWLTEKGRRLHQRTQEVLNRNLLQQSLNVLTETQRLQLLESLQALLAAAHMVLTNKRDDS